MKTPVPTGAPVLGFLVGALILVGCGAQRATPSEPSATPATATSTTDFPLPRATAPPPWSSITLGPVVREPFGGPGNQFIMGMTAYGDGFVAVGEDFQSDANVDGTVWTSRNGHDWIRLATAVNGLTRAEVDAVATSGRRVVAVGHARAGVDDGGRRAGIVWTSDDGASWRRLENPAPFGNAEIEGVVGGPASFVAWGADGNHAAIFRSTDGTSWTKAPDDGLFAGAQVGDVRPYRGGFVAVGGHGAADAGPQAAGPDLSTSAAWWTADGAAWQAASTDQGFGFRSVEVGAAGLIALGSGSCGRCVGPATMWRSDDGRSWKHVGNDVAKWPDYVSDGARIIRYDWQGSGDVLESVDGSAWQKVGTTGRLSVYSLALGPHGIVIGAPVSDAVGDVNDGAVRFVAAR